MPYDISLASSSQEKNFQKIKDHMLSKKEEVKEEPKIKPEYLKKKCTNCFCDPLNGRSLGVYRKGGLMFFDKGPCPVCKGSGKA